MTEIVSKTAATKFGQFNFLVTFNDVDDDGIEAAFQECSGLAPLTEANSLTLKRGVITNHGLERLLQTKNNVAEQTITIHQLQEDQSYGVSRHLRKARLTRFVSGSRNDNATDIAIEELVLAYERLDLDD